MAVLLDGAVHAANKRRVILRTNSIVDYVDDLLDYLALRAKGPTVEHFDRLTDRLMSAVKVAYRKGDTGDARASWQRAIDWMVAHRYFIRDVNGVHSYFSDFCTYVPSKTSLLASESGPTRLTSYKWKIVVVELFADSEIRDPPYCFYWMLPGLVQLGYSIDVDTLMFDENIPFEDVVDVMSKSTTRRVLLKGADVMGTIVDTYKPGAEWHPDDIRAVKAGTARKRYLSPELWAWIRAVVITH
jgi:hypothetical protein